MMLKEVISYPQVQLEHYILSHPGKRKLNEDSVYPEHVNGHGARSFVVCDGVGGGNRGDIASQIVSREVGQILNGIEEATEDLIFEAIRSAEIKLREHSTEFPDSRGMATTIVGFHPENGGKGWAYWVGDSRLYHIRNREILYRTKDHSLVQMMVDKGEMTEAEAMSSKSRNVIMQAVSDSQKQTEPDITLLEDIQSGDHILLLSDGILEGITEAEMTQILSSSDMKSAIATIRSKCEEKSSDNFSMIAIEVV